ncbi:hypothetical protein FXO38_11174 [Capsicum annuum]|nr:hypothetical protein FXO37_15068 [Capsicum annuum]KAF3662434.1 hypothetical protein FXO38_11174 [Capsicum annuum]
MTTALGKFSPALVQEFYAAYKGELKRQYSQGNLWRGGDLVTSLTIHGVWVNISLRTISKFLHGLELQPPVNTKDINYHMDKMLKVTKKQMELADKLMHFRWITNIIAPNREETS